MKRSLKYVISFAASLISLSSPVRATLLDGQTVATTYFRGTAPDTTSQIGPVKSVVGPGGELTNFAGYLDIDFSDTNILITATADANPLGYFEEIRFFDVNGTIPTIAGVTLDPATNFTGLNASDIIFNADTITVNLTTLAGLQGQIISLDLNGGAPPVGGPTGVPEPWPAALFGLGIGLLSLRLVRRPSSR